MSDQAPAISVSSLCPATTPAPSQDAPEVPNPVSPEADADDLALQLKPEQQTALRHLLAGLSIKDAAAETGIGRRTLFRWLREDHTFASLFNLWKREQIQSARAQALALAGPAMKTIGNAIDKGHVFAALHVARHLGLLQPAKPGPTDPDRLSDQRTLAARRRKLIQNQKVAQLKEQEDKLPKPQDARHLNYSVHACTGIIQWYRELREKAVLREAEKYKMTLDEIRKDYLEKEAEWAQETLSEMARLNMEIPTPDISHVQHPSPADSPAPPSHPPATSSTPKSP